MRKVIGVGAVLLLAGAVMAPANAATPVTANVPSAVVSTVSVQAPADAVVDFESPAVATEAAPVVEAVPVAPVTAEAEPVAPVETPAVPVAPVAPATVAETPNVPTADAGGTVEQTETETPVEVVPEVPAEPTPEPTEPDPVPTPEPTEEAPLVLEGDAYAYSEYDPAFWEYNLNPETGEPYEGAYVGTYWARSIDYFAGRDDVEIRLQPGVHRTVDGNPMSSEYLYVFHLWSKVAAE